MTNGRNAHSRISQKRCCGFLLLIWLLSLMVPVYGSDEKTEYGKIVRGTHDGIRFDNTCVSFTAFMRAGEFFDGLQRIRTPEGTEFRRNSKVVNYFPDQISVEIEAKVAMCSEVLRRLGVSVPGYAEAFMSTLRFEAKWKKGVRSRPAEIVSVELSRPAWPERTNDYVYVLTVSSHRVPLSDHVVVHVLSGDGETVARMSVRL